MLTDGVVWAVISREKNNKLPDLCLLMHNSLLYITGDYLFAMNPLMDWGMLLTYREGLFPQVLFSILSEDGERGQ